MTMRRMPPLWRFLLVPVCGSAALSACGGSDQSARPNEQRVIDSAPFDECAQADGLEFQSIASYEMSPRDNNISPNLNYAQGSANRCAVSWIQVDPDNPALDQCCAPGTGPGTNHPACESAATDPSLAVNGSHWPNVDDSPRTCASFTTINCLDANGQPYPDDMGTQPSPTTYCVPRVPMNPAPAPVERCGQADQAVHIQETNLAICFSPRSHKPGWGGNYRITFNNPVDASDWDGVSFWAKTGDGPTGTGLLPHILDPYTIGGDKNRCSTSPKETTPDQAKCDPWSLSAVLTGNWRFYQMPFDEVRQKGFGMASDLEHIDRSAIRAVEFSFSAGDWDFWIDDVTFYRVKR